MNFAVTSLWHYAGQVFGGETRLRGSASKEHGGGTHSHASTSGLASHYQAEEFVLRIETFHLP
jgi:hypothetical protein